jgi:nicotinamidase-related amidase
MNRALVLVDIQNDYFAGGRMVLEGADPAADRAASLLRHFRSRGEPVLHVQHVSVRPNATFFLPDTPGVQIHPAVAPQAGEPVIRKNFPNAFRATPLDTELRSRGVTRLVIAGMMTHMCIDTTVRAAFDLGFAVDLAHDACATRALQFGDSRLPAAQVHESFIAALHGTFANARAAAQIIEAAAEGPR